LRAQRAELLTQLTHKDTLLQERPSTAALESLKTQLAVANERLEVQKQRFELEKEELAHKLSESVASRVAQEATDGIFSDSEDEPQKDASATTTALQNKIADLSSELAASKEAIMERDNQIESLSKQNANLEHERAGFEKVCFGTNVNAQFDRFRAHPGNALN